MTDHLKDIIKGLLIVPLSLGLVFVPLSLLIGWNIVTLLLFWFIVIPVIAFVIPLKVSKDQYLYLKSLLGISIFYGLIVFLIYDHHQSDYFRVMIISYFINMIILLITLLTRDIQMVKRKKVEQIN